MKPRIDSTRFGSIIIAGEVFEHDLLISLNGEKKRRRKKLSKEVFGTSHIVSLAEAEYIYEKGAQRLIVGTGQTGMVTLSSEAADFFKAHECQVELWPTPKAIQVWNEAQGAVMGLFHVTC
jgi:hypothetical protein